MSKVKYGDPFSMGNLDDLMYARENNDVEYLKEWSKMVVEEHGKARDIQLKAYANLIELGKLSKMYVEEVQTMLKDSCDSLHRTKSEEKT